jgi:hypothetical protein
MFNEQEPELNSPPRSGEGPGEGLNPELAAIERKLADLTPMAPRFDRDQLMWSAGRAAERAAHLAGPSWAGRTDSGTRATGSASAHFWPAATAAMTAATLLLSAMLLQQHAPQPIAQKTTNPRTSAVAESTDVPAGRFSTRSWASQPTRGYLGLRRVALTRGISTNAPEFNVSLPATPSQAEPATARELLDELLPKVSHQRS